VVLQTQKTSTSSVSSGYEQSVSSSQGTIDCSETESHSSKSVHLNTDDTATCSEAVNDDRLLRSESIVVSADSDNEEKGIKKQTNSTPANLSDSDSPQSTDDGTDSSQYF